MFLLLSLIYTTLQADEIIIIVISVLSTVVLLLYLRTTSEVKLVIEKNRITNRSSRNNLKNSFVVFLEISNLATYSQFYDINLSDKIFNQIYREAIKKVGKNCVFLYRTDQLVFILDFQNETVINQALRFEEQYRSAKQIIKHLCNLTYKINNKEENYDVKLVAGCASVGIREEVNSIEELIKLAHFSMLKAKEHKKEIVVADDETHIIKQDLDSFNKEIEEGFELDEFSPFFFPIINVKTSKIVGCESLVRWRKNKYRIIEASKFKEIADEKNLFEKIDKRVIEKTLYNYSIWRELNLVDKEFTITINLSLKSLMLYKTYELISLVKSYDVDPSNVEFDISENDISSQAAIQAILNLKKANFKIALDAFKSQSFSLSSVMAIDISTIKIDKSRMPQETDGDRVLLLYKTLTKFCKIMNLNVMSKGIENINQYKLVKKLDIDLVQGYYFTPPLDEVNIQVFLKKYKDGILTP